MTTPEQQAREMLAALELPFMAEAFSASRLAPLANLIDENIALKAELEAIKGVGEPGYCFVYEWDTPFGAVHRSLSPSPYNGNAPSRIVPVYTRPATPLTDERASDLGREMVKAGKSAEWLVREVECAHNIKGAKP